MKISAGLWGFFIFINLFMAQVPVRAQLNYIAHRGASYLAPENTIASINLAWELDSDGAECDIMLTKDQKIVVFHDSNMNRLLGKEGLISESDYDNFKDLPIKLRESNMAQYAGESVPLLRDLLQATPLDKILVIEIKCGQEIIPVLRKEIKKYGYTGTIAFIAFDYETIIETKKVFPDNECYYLSSDPDDLNRRFNQIIESDLDGVDLNYRMIDRELVTRFTSHHKKVWCWTINSAEDALRMKEAGVEYITTDRPAWLKDTLSK